MNKIPHFLKQLFSPKDLHNLDIQDLLGAMSDASIRKVWLSDLFDELKRLNLDVDNRLLSGARDVSDLAVRRKAFQDVLEGVLSARRRVKNPNPRFGSFDLDSVTVQTD